MSSDSQTHPTREQIGLVESSWNQIAPHQAELARSFYEQLFALDPNIEPLFSGTDMEQQGKKLTDTLTVAVKGLQHFPALVPALGELGNRHVSYGVKEEHYTCVRTALISAIGNVLGDQFTAETKEAWSVTYDALAAVMKDGLQENPKPV